MDLRRRRSTPSVQSGEEAALREALGEMEKLDQADEKGPASSPSVSVLPSGGQCGSEQRSHGEASGPPPNEAPSVSPFWSPKMMAEAELRRARPRDLDDAIVRMGSPQLDGGTRPRSLEEVEQRATEVRVDDSVMDPAYSSMFSSMFKSGEMPVPDQSQSPAQDRAPDQDDAAGPGGRSVEGHISPGPAGSGLGVSQGADQVLDPNSGKALSAGSLELGEQGPSPDAGGRVDVEQAGSSSSLEARVPAERAEIGAVERKLEARLETELELTRMRSLVEHLTDRLDRVECERAASVGSASSGKLGWVDYQALDRELARQAQQREIEAFRQGFTPL